MIVEFKTPYDFIEELAETIEKTRIQKKLTQKELCQMSGVALSTYQKFLYQKNINLINIVKIMYTLDMLDNLNAFVKHQEILSMQDLKKQEKKLPKRVRSASS